jgi:hypothetical protein
VYGVEESPDLLNPSNGWIQNTNNWPFSAAGANSPKQRDYPAYMDSGSENPRGVHAIRILDKKKGFTLESLIAGAFDSFLTEFAIQLPLLLNAYDQKYRPEMHSVERSLVLEQLDSAWKSHLLTMDSLRSGVGLRGYAQEDPKIVYKREGMQEFETMWEGVRDRITEAVFRIEEMGDEEAQAALWAGARESHQAAITAMQARQAQDAEASMQTNTSSEGKKAEPIRNIGQKVGRNDPCPCGSGKKYKNCHMKLEDGKR